MNTQDPWHQSQPYERFMGRWSRLVADRFLLWLDADDGLRWLEVGCGTGALTFKIVECCRPHAVLAVDQSPLFIEHARQSAGDSQMVHFEVADAGRLPVADGSYDVAVAALALNFFPDVVAALRELRRAVRKGGTLALYVWDYAEGMEMLRLFWDAAVSLDPAAAALDEQHRFPICNPDRLRKAATAAGWSVTQTSALQAPARFDDFDDYWQPFLGGVGPAPGYVAGLTNEQRAELAAALRARLPQAEDGSITLQARAWALSARH